ncbi:MAG TPA: hypothetical protein VFH83_08570, partial [Spirochaetia bacterium]|nr:hypothetical protein [Spirochaetia bacterium]
MAILLLPSLPGSSPRPSQPWRRYHTILVRSDSQGPDGMEGLVRRLKAAAGPGVVTELTAPVDFWDFSGVATVAYARLDSRLDPLDPRRDPYLNGLRSYLRTAGASAEWRIA